MAANRHRVSGEGTGDLGGAAGNLQFGAQRSLKPLQELGRHTVGGEMSRKMSRSSVRIRTSGS